jgi:hypothetical protein
MEACKVEKWGGEVVAVGGKAAAAASKLRPTEKVRGDVWGRRVAAGSGGGWMVTAARGSAR